jgi:choline dehydrogenase-like flavoprotein
MPGYGFMGGIQRFNGKFAHRDGSPRTQGSGGYGLQLKEDYRMFYGATIGFAGRGEPVPVIDNYCEIDPQVVDQWGIPVLRFHFKWSDYEYKQAKHMQDTFEEIIHQLKGIPLWDKPGKEQGYGLEAPGRIIHEVGVARMGKDNRSSVVNAMGQSHDVKNLFINDGATFVSNADKNPTWTILALSLRTSEYIIEERKKGNI